MRPDVLICAHNEQETVADVISAARWSESVGSIIVVSDLSSDWTANQCRGADVVLQVGAGDKGTAMAAGLPEVYSDTTLLLDADLVGLQPEHVWALATAAPEVGQVVGLRSNKGATGGLPSLSGERRLPTWLLREVDLAGAGWATETRINAAVGNAGLPWRHLVLRGVRNPTKAASDPLEWVSEAAQVALAGIVNLPGLVAYVRHPGGRPG